MLTKSKIYKFSGYNFFLYDLNKENKPIKDFPISSSRLAELIKMVESGLLSNKQAREIFTKMMKTGEEPHKLITELGIIQINDEDVIMKIVNKVLDDNPNLVDEYKKGKSDNNTIGLLLCRDAKTNISRITLNNINLPLGISKYKFIEELPSYLEKRLNNKI